MHNFKELVIWKKARELAKEIYLLCDEFPKAELYGISSQMKRAVISIPSNIAEGAGRTTKVEFCRFLDIATGSAFELETQLYLAFDFGFISESNLQEISSKLESLQKMIYTFKKTINNSNGAS